MAMRVLHKGISGSDVKAWQAFLVEHGFALIQVDGFFGPQTRRATISFQSQQRLIVDGIVGSNTLARGRARGFNPQLPVLITAPASFGTVALGDAIELRGLADPEVARVELEVDEAFAVPTPTLVNGEWWVTNRFHSGGTRRVVARAFDGAGAQLGVDEVALLVNEPHFGSLVPIPADVNHGLTMVSQSMMLEVLGVPGDLTADCSPVTNSRVRALMVTRDVGPFVASGLRPAVEALERIFARVRADEPVLYAQLRTAGMLCCRRIRSLSGQPPSRFFSNHSWGTAIDISINGALDPRGNGTTQLGLLTLHPYFKAEKFFWGAGFSGGFEDSMHFEASAELIGAWNDEGRLNP